MTKRLSYFIIIVSGIFIFSGCIKSEKSDTITPPTFIERLYSNSRAQYQINTFCKWLCKDNHNQYLNYTTYSSQQLSGHETLVEITVDQPYQSSFSGMISYTFKEQQQDGKKIISLRDKDNECLENCPVLPGIPHEVTEYIIGKYGDPKEISGRVGFSESFQQGNYYIARAIFFPKNFIAGESINKENEQLFVGYWSGGRQDLYQGSSEKVSCEALKKVNYPSALLEKYNMTCTSGANHSVPGETKYILGIPHTITEIIGQIVPTGQNYQTFISNYLKEQGVYNYIIEKKISKGDITTISMKQNTDDNGCHFELGSCMVFIFRKNQVIWENSTSLINNFAQHTGGLSQGHGRFYRYTDHGVLLEIQNGEGLGCIDGITYTYQYIHLKDLKSIWYTFDIIKEGKSPDPKDEGCENPKTVWKERQVLRFFSSYSDTRDSKKALTIQAKTTEEAYYKYYNQ